jgi:hypothetical protein
MSWYAEWAAKFPAAARRQEEIRSSELSDADKLAAFVRLDSDFPEAMSAWREKVVEALDQQGMGPEQVRERTAARIRAGEDGDASLS